MTFGTKQITNDTRKPYAAAADFCRIFIEDMDSLYLLSLFLTADPDLAEKCFVQGLEDAQKGNPVFREWARSWARRTIITNAIRVLGPRADRAESNSATGRTLDPGRAVGPLAKREEMAAVLALPTFERFAFVMSVLEGFSDRECALLLECSIGDVVAARIRALQQLGAAAQLQREPIDAQVEHQRLLEHSPVSIAPGWIARLAASV